MLIGGVLFVLSLFSFMFSLFWPWALLIFVPLASAFVWVWRASLKRQETARAITFEDGPRTFGDLVKRLTQRQQHNGGPY
ncbi:MAG TPA: hypothetical protein VNT79_08880 [Phycisphaerae bacterium]|nr:hypothetical protein [Phycisphaerae bacterium]